MVAQSPFGKNVEMVWPRFPRMFRCWKQENLFRAPYCINNYTFVANQINKPDTFQKRNKKFFFPLSCHNISGAMSSSLTKLLF